MILHTEIDVETLRDYGRMKKYFFDMLACITLDRIRELQKAAGNIIRYLQIRQSIDIMYMVFS